MLGERPLEARERSLEVASRREHERAAAREDRERRRPVEHGRSRLLAGEDGIRLVELAGGDERLEQVAEVHSHGRLEHEVPEALVRASQVR